MTIAKLAHAGDVGVETVRYYQRRGLLTEPERPKDTGMADGFRRYGVDDVRRLKFIRSAKRQGSRSSKSANFWRSMRRMTGPVCATWRRRGSRR